MSIEDAREVLRIEEQGLAAVREKIGKEFIEAVELILKCPSRLVITGIGKSGIIGQKISATLNSTGTASYFLHPVEAMHGDLGMVQPTDVVLAISYSGETLELNNLLGSLKRRCAALIGMTGNKSSALAAYSDVILDIAIPKEACRLGLAPTTSTTATLALGDALAVVLMNRKQFHAADFRQNHPAGSLGERLKIRVGEVMLTGERVPRVTNGTMVFDAVSELNRKNLGAVLVVSEQMAVDGIVTDGDVRRFVSGGIDFRETPVRSVMTESPVVIDRNTQAVDALSIMQRYEITVLPVVNETGRLEGILHLHDLLGKGEFRFLI